jgi:phage tail tube protein FII
MDGKLFEAKIGALKAGDKLAEHDFTFEVDYLKIEIDGEMILEETLWEQGSFARTLML